MDKAALRDELLALLTETLATARAAHASAIEGATHPEAKAENDKDTRALEQSYIARGQAQRVAELEAAVATLGKLELRTFSDDDPIAFSALVTASEDDEERTYFVVPHGGGSTLAGGVLVVTPQSPIGAALVGKRVDDAIELRVGGKQRELAIVRVQ